MNIQHIVTTQKKPWKISSVKSSAVQQTNLSTSGKRFQTVKGFGGCFNELGFDVLSRLKPADQKKIIESLFGESGCRFNFCRMPIGASDYALEWYSLNETAGDYQMKHFSIDRDRKYLIPYIRMAQSFRKELELFASPWSPPTWMKTHRVYNFGTLKMEPKNLQAYALYFLKFVEAYEKQGIRIRQIHIQNEPMADQKFPSCRWTGEQFLVFIRDYIGPLFEKHKIPTEIWLGTINGPEAYGPRALDSRFDQYANLVLSDPKARRYVKGVGYQWAGKNALQRTHTAYPDVPLLQTENECGDGNNTWQYAHYVFELMNHYFSNQVIGYVYWNMILKPRGESTWGWTQNSMITIDPDTGKVIYNPEYYVMKHVSHFIRPGAVRLDLQGQWSSNALAFENPNGEKVLIIANPFQEERELNTRGSEVSFSAKLQPSSFNTFVL